MTTPIERAEREVRLGLAASIQESLDYQAYAAATREPGERVVEVSAEELAELERGVQRANEFDAAEVRLLAAAQEEARAREAREREVEERLYELWRAW